MMQTRTKQVPPALLLFSMYLPSWGHKAAFYSEGLDPPFITPTLFVWDLWLLREGNTDNPPDH